MTTDLDPRPAEPLERRLRAACHAVIPHLLDVDEGWDDSMLDIGSSTLTVDVNTNVAPLRVGPRRSRWVSIAAAALVLAGAGAVWAAQQRDGTQPAASEPLNTPVVTVPPTLPSSNPGSSVPCYDDGCAALDRLPVIAGATDFYAGPVALGVPQVAIEFLDSLTRCAELTSDFSACQRIEGIAGVNLVSYTTETTVDTTAQSESSYTTNIGTTFTDLSPAQYAAQWAVSGAGPAALTAVTVRGHDAVRYAYAGAPGVVWQERPGVLVWVSTPPEAEDQLMTIAEGIRRLDGPTTIPNRVMVSPLAKVWDAGDNDGDGVIVASAGGTECVGLDYLETCGEGITSRTITRSRFEPAGTTRVAGSTPAGVSRVRIGITGAAPITVDTITFANYASRFYLTTVPSGDVESVTWLDDQGNEIDSTAISAPPLDVASGPPATETVP